MDCITLLQDIGGKSEEKKRIFEYCVVGNKIVHQNQPTQESSVVFVICCKIIKTYFDVIRACKQVIKKFKPTDLFNQNTTYNFEFK